MIVVVAFDIATLPWQQKIEELDFISPFQVSAIHVSVTKRKLMMMIMLAPAGQAHDRTFLLSMANF